MNDRVVNKACDYLEQNLSRRVELAELAEHLNYSPEHLQRLFKESTGVSPREWAEALRIRRLKEELAEGGDVLGSFLRAGFSSPSAAYEASSRHLGMSPSDYRAGGAGERLHWATAESEFGQLLVAVSSKGVAAVSLGGSRQELEASLKKEFPAADLEPGFELQRIAELLAADPAGASRLELPLAVRASSFQWRVWRELRSIGGGETISYSDLAERIGSAGSQRAVGGAVAANRLALVIPCHRVVRANGTPGNYRWGSETKRKLLAGELSR